MIIAKEKYKDTYIVYIDESKNHPPVHFEDIPIAEMAANMVVPTRDFATAVHCLAEALTQLKGLEILQNEEQ